MLIGYSQAGPAFLSILGSIAVLSLMMVLKRHKETHQRLIMYLAISVFFNSISFIVRGMGYKLIKNKYFCQVTAFYGQLTAGFILSSIWCIIIEIVVSTCRQKGAGKLEWIYLILIFIIPAITSVIPFVNNGYGESKVWCWIRDKNDDGEMFPYGLILRYVLWYGPLYSLMLVGGTVYLIGLLVNACKLRKHSALYSSDFSREKKKIFLKKLTQFRWYPVLFFTYALIQVANHIYEYFNRGRGPLVELWIAQSVVEGLQGVFVALLYIFHRSTRIHILHRLIILRNRCIQYDNPYLDESTPLSQSPNNSYEALPQRAKTIQIH